MLKGAVCMGGGFFRNLLAFLVALVLTLGTVMVLSAATQKKADAADRYSQQVRQEETQVEELSAPVQSRRPASFLEAAGGFLLIIAVSGAGAMLLLRIVRKGRASHKGQAYRPKKDMAHIVRRV